MEFFTGHDLELFVRLATAMMLGLMVGLERTYAHKTAGLRTYALVAMASALFVIAGQEMVEYYGGRDFDPLRIASQVVVGVGFLGAGMIIVREKSVMNITTAAAIWIAAGIGMASGFGLYSVAVFGTLLTLFILGFLSIVEGKMKLNMRDD